MDLQITKVILVNNCVSVTLQGFAKSRKHKFTRCSYGHRQWQLLRPFGEREPGNEFFLIFRCLIYRYDKSGYPTSWISSGSAAESSYFGLSFISVSVSWLFGDSALIAEPSDASSTDKAQIRIQMEGCLIRVFIMLVSPEFERISK